ncbi:hypothetical protein QO207_08605 [Pseudomonas sp. CAN2814]|uniref:helix-turn-helix domain-containing protein n=1 Tax=Pseudomonas sp. CAN1 TaxID=3046726 RepID=UPI0026487C05|nr:helix-turn-helix domain-containing protein [Pseudomonas sp. CAN1]MDN6856646.1 hypothetical protein [Pseudomonas sp. CAN1]
MTERTQKSADRIMEAIRTLHEESPDKQITITAVCNIAEVSRNTIYRYHKDALERIRQLNKSSRPEPPTLKDTVDKLTRENRALTLRQEKLAALIDHYFSAWQEAKSKSEHQQRELAELRKLLRSAPKPING